jgi:hypothetical protein
VRRSAFESRMPALRRLAQRVPLFLAGEGALALPSAPAGTTVLPADLRVAAGIVDVVPSVTTVAPPPSTGGRPSRATGERNEPAVG